MNANLSTIMVSHVDVLISVQIYQVWPYEISLCREEPEPEPDLNLTFDRATTTTIIYPQRPCIPTVPATSRVADCR